MSESESDRVAAGLLGVSEAFAANRIDEEQRTTLKTRVLTGEGESVLQELSKLAITTKSETTSEEPETETRAPKNVSSSYAVYIYKVLKQIDPDIGISQKAM